MAKSTKQDPTPKKTVTKTVILAPGVLAQLAALEEQKAQLDAQHQLLTQTAIMQAGITGAAQIVGYDPKTRKITLHVTA